ncbi:uncharacterized protein LOC129284826 [Prosopis cineraria]|uniref:uncharacterized protein LOC129284826 n=1 Tax=Prosopis cineraria TaxID=364024 RepID=UPI0024109419|nr:uncharacterized protein LOC129284826 [Prosopis cineraria]
MKVLSTTRSSPLLPLLKHNHEASFQFLGSLPPSSSYLISRYFFLKKNLILKDPNINPFSFLIDHLEKGFIMLRSVVAITGIIGLAAISHNLLRHYLTSSKSLTRKPQSGDKNQKKPGCTVQEAMISNFDALDVLDDLYSLFELFQELHCHLMEDMTRRIPPPLFEYQGKSCNSNAFDSLEWRKPILGNVMEALTDPTIHLIGVYGLHDEIKDTLLQRVRRRVQRDQLFDMVVTAAVTKYPDMRKIQEDIASQLGLAFIHVSKDKRAIELMDRIKNEQKILVVLCNLHKGLHLGKLGIPYGANHTGCKILLTSTYEDVLSNHMHTHINFMV